MQQLYLVAIGLTLHPSLVSSADDGLLICGHDHCPVLADQLLWPPNVWMGVTVEHADYIYRINDLRKTPAGVKFLSCEPLLGPLPGMDLAEIDWLIAGGESEPGARLMRKEWVLDIRDHRGSQLAVASGIQVGGGIDHPVEVVWNPAHLVRSRSGGDDLQTAVKLEGIGVDDLAVQGLGEVQGDAAFARCGRAADVEGSVQFL